jgi:hypothetical protein
MIESISAVGIWESPTEICMAPRGPTGKGAQQLIAPYSKSAIVLVSLNINALFKTAFIFKFIKGCRSQRTVPSNMNRDICSQIELEKSIEFNEFSVCNWL